MRRWRCILTSSTCSCTSSALLEAAVKVLKRHDQKSEELVVIVIERVVVVIVRKKIYSYYWYMTIECEFHGIQLFITLLFVEHQLRLDIRYKILHSHTMRMSDIEKIID